MAMPVTAQDLSRTGLEEVVVTARKREESLQEVPLSVSALDSQTIARAGIEDLSSVASFTAGLTYQDYAGGGLGSPTIRGQAQTDIRSVDNNVGVFVDGVFVSSRGNLDFALLDMERVEVVKGPQSALYGNNTFAGAINYVTKGPTDQLSGQTSATVGNAGRRDASFMLSGPILDTLGGSFTAGYSEFDGTIDNRLGEDLGGWDKKVSATGKLEYRPTDNFTAKAFFYYGEADFDSTAGTVYVNNCGGFNSTGSTTVTGRGGSVYRFYCGDLKAPNQVTVRDDITYGNQSVSRLGYVSLDWDLGAVTVSSLTSLGNYDSNALVDFFYNARVNTPPAGRQVLIPDFGGSKDWSQEVRIDSDPNKRIDWTVGGYLSHFKIERQFASGVPANPRQNANNFDVTESDTWAVFGRVGFDLTERLNLDVEARYNNDDRDAALLNRNTGIQVNLDDTFSATTYRVSLDFQATDDVMFYVSNARGSKSGGFNNSPLASEQTFDPEQNLVYEVGVKSQWLGGALTLNSSLFYSKWEDAQLQTVSAVAGNTNITRNAGNVTTYGGEVEVLWHATDAWLLSAGYGYANPTFDDGTIDVQHDRRCATAAACGFAPGPGGIGVDVSGKQVDRSIKHTGNFSSTYTWFANAFDVYLRTDATYTGEQPQRSLNLDFIPGRTLVNARIGVDFDSGLEVAAWARNLLDKQYIYSSVNQPERAPISSFTTGHVANGRTYGLTATYKF